MTTLHELSHYLHTALQSDSFSDYCPNGIQVRGQEQIKRIVTGVSASMALFEGAQACSAELILVHHGLFWNKDSRVVDGMLKNRLKWLLERDVTLMGYHLPLDAHPEWGNNAQILKRLGLVNSEPFGGYKGNTISYVGHYSEPQTIEQVSEQFENLFGGEPLILPFGPKQISRVAVCSGGASDLVHEAATVGADLYLTGEPSEPAYHVAQEMGIHFAACGHHRTEMFGVQAVGEHLAEKFGLDHTFINIPNPI
uniref:Nif3-like dinuclear metal center hexameric protein n=1 Tax=Magnetococcus massalia (strain MO-1) TaxID=451514 RepID=A0A1S7LN83_MAGMO|nr:conserved protein of unknown function [Candidatus Magnetococcus massalia]